jgi:hypothetical protein
MARSVNSTPSVVIGKGEEQLSVSYFLLARKPVNKSRHKDGGTDKDENKSKPNTGRCFVFAHLPCL